MTRRTRGFRFVLLGAALALAGCFGGRGRSGVAPVRSPADSVGARPPAPDSTKTPRDSAKAAADSATKARGADSAAVTRRDSAAADSTAPKVPRKTAPATKQCVLDFTGSPPETRLRYQRLPDSTSLTFIGGGFVGHCQGEQNEIRADSAEQYQASGIMNLFGNVSYEEPGKMRIQSQRATYFTREERLFADGNVIATQLESGSTFRGSSIEYLRAIPGSRPFSKLIAPNRPTVQLVEKDSTGKPGPPITITANTMVDEGDTKLFAWGEVQINRTTLQGESDSASFDKVTELARLIRTARIINRDQAEPFRLFGDTIDLYSKDQQLTRVVALHNGNASNADVVMQAEQIDLRFTTQKLERAMAFGKGRAKATTASQTLLADSIDVRMPEQRVREVRAVGMAEATGAPDTLKIKSEDRDVLRGDTVIAWFDSTSAPGDTTQRARIQAIRAAGNASSLFQIASKQGPTAPAALNYVRGQVIRLAFDSGQVRDVTVDSAASGLYLEPVVDSLSDSTAKRPAPAPRPPVPPAPTAPDRSPIHLSVLVSDHRRRS
jgi:hypothetical protein